MTKKSGYKWVMIMINKRWQWVQTKAKVIGTAEENRKLVEQQKGEIEKLQARVRELEQQVEIEKLQTRNLELQKQVEIEKLQARNGESEEQVEIEKLQTGNGESQVDDKTKSEVEVEILKEKVDELTGSIETLQDINQILMVKERQYNDELQEARAVLIQEIGESSNSGSFTTGIKRMGDLDLKPFGDSLKDICSSSSTDQVTDQSVLLCSFWEQMLKDPLWHPFKIACVDGKFQELIDEEDKLLKGLKDSWGEEAYLAVVTALVELNEYAPSARCPTQELWNFEENRRATTKEGVLALAHHLRRHHHPTDDTTTKS